MTTTSKRNEISMELIAKCSRFEIELPGGKSEVRYAVESRTEVGVEYVVKFIRGKGLVCNCPAGNPPVDSRGIPLYAPRPCWHMRAAVAHAELYRKEQATIARNERIALLMGKGLTREEAVEAVESKLIVDGKPADLDTLARVFRGKGAPTEQDMERMAKAHSPRPFAILR
jgi:hypothetical protein